MEIFVDLQENKFGWNGLRRLAVIVPLICVISCSFSGQEGSDKKYTESRSLMGTVVRVDLCRHPENNPKEFSQALSKVWERLEEIHWRMSVFDDRSDVMKINRAYPDAVAIGADTYQVIKDAFRFSQITKGAFDITVWPLIKIWKESAQNNTLPDLQKIQEALSVVGEEHLELMPNATIRVLNPQTRIDLGGIAKGYGVDEAVRILREHEINHFLIDAGGDLFVSGHNCEGQLWRIGIKDPRNTTKIMEVVQVSNAAVATSGDYEQFYEIQGQQWSHIINLVTGYPQKQVVSATVIAPRAQDADALATALTVLAPIDGLNVIKSMGEGFASIAMIKQQDGQIITYQSETYTPLKYSTTR